MFLEHVQERVEYKHCRWRQADDQMSFAHARSVECTTERTTRTLYLLQNLRSPFLFPSSFESPWFWKSRLPLEEYRSCSQRRYQTKSVSMLFSHKNGFQTWCVCSLYMIEQCFCPCIVRNFHRDLSHQWHCHWCIVLGQIVENCIWVPYWVFRRLFFVVVWISVDSFTELLKASASHYLCEALDPHEHIGPQIARQIFESVQQSRHIQTKTGLKLLPWDWTQPFRYHILLCLL